MIVLVVGGGVDDNDHTPDDTQHKYTYRTREKMIFVTVFDREVLLTDVLVLLLLPTELRMDKSMQPLVLLATSLKSRIV